VSSFQVVGQPLSRWDGARKLMGTAIYTSDATVPGMVHGRILRSVYAHARVLKLDTRNAEALPGVLAVLTQEDVRGFPLYGAAFKDQSIVTIDRVRYVGEPVAAVAALDEATAQEAITLIDVDYEELPAVTSVDEALQPTAPLVHEDLGNHGEQMGYHYQAQPGHSGTNVCYSFGYSKGDIGIGFKKSAYIFEHTFTFPRVQHYSLEPHATVAQVDGDQITVWASTQDPFTLRTHLASIFRVPLHKVRVIVLDVGGGYGGKLSIKTEPLAVALARKARRPVKIVHSVEESFKTVTRHPAKCRIKTGVSRDGILLAQECEIYMDTGAYADAGPRVTQKAGYRAQGPYRIPHIKTSAYTVYTNTIPAGAFRGFGTPQVCWAYESQLNIIAHKLGIDALELRLKNLLRKGEHYIPGDAPVDCDLSAGLLRAAKAIGWGKGEIKPFTGKGISCCMKDGGGTYKGSEAIVKMTPDGSVFVLTGTIELGQGAHTALSQVVAEELGIALDRVVVTQVDTDFTPYDSGTYASSSTVVMGLCVQRAAQAVKIQLLRAASKPLQERIDHLILKNGRVYNRKGQSISYQDVISTHIGSKAMNISRGSKGGDIVGRGTYQDKKSKRALLGSPTTFWEISWGAAEIQVDPESGDIKIQNYVSITDVGKAINPQECIGQDEGAVVFGIGHTLSEEMIYENGQPLNPNLLDYRVPRFSDIPSKFESILMEDQNGPGPYGAKGIGEGGILPVASAVAEALYNAVGVRILELPLTPEKVWRAMREKEAL
jgi:CO/xanthine dehydrogenase Mo-binding subunit